MKRIMAGLAAAALLPGLFLGRVQALDIGGKSACLMERSTGQVLYQHNAHEKLAPASVTKVMTLLLIMEAVDSGSIGWEDPVTASETAAAKGGSQVYLKAGEVFSVRDMVKAIAVSSANDCACAMAEHLAGTEEAFVEKMNAKAWELGMQDTHFVNCTGLDDSPEARQHRTSAWDIALMSRELLDRHPGIREFTTIWMDTLRNGTFGLSNTNKMVRFYKGCTGLKTGFTSGAGFCLSASAQREDMELIAVILGAESSKERFADCRAMLDYGFAGFTVYTPELKDLGGVPVVLGQEKTALAVPAEQKGILLPRADTGSLHTEITLEEVLQAPVSRGQRIGMVRICKGDQVLREIPLLSREPVQKLSWPQIFRLALAGTLQMKRQ